MSAALVTLPRPRPVAPLRTLPLRAYFTVAGALAVSAAVVLAAPTLASTSQPAAQTAAPAASGTSASSTLAPFPSLGGLKVGARDTADGHGALQWEPTTGRQFASAYTYISPPDDKSTHGPGGSSNYAMNAVYFVQASQASHVQPVLTWFVADSDWHGAGVAAACSTPCSQGDTARRNLDHLGDSSFTTDYFQTLEATLKAIAPLSAVKGQPSIVVQVEPDLSGYAEQLTLDRTRCGSDCLSTVAGETPNAVVAAVGSTGLPELKGLPDTLTGFYSAILRLRDQLAPKVDLGFHVSGWAASAASPTATGARLNDVNSSPTYVNVGAIASRIAGFASAAALSTVPAGSRGWQDLFIDVQDHDAAYAELVQKQSQYWWDTENKVEPNFSRWESFASQLHALTKLPLVLWQVPLGNQEFLSENDTAGHYQDNRAEYFLRHPQELTSAGVSAIIFGGGHAVDTNSSDRTGDGITNPAPVCSTRGSASGTKLCTHLTSTTSDDDGGLLRAAAQQQLPPLS